MSDVDTSTEVETEVIPEDESLGQDESVETEGEPTEVEPELFVWDDYADKNVRLTVDGEEIVVPVREAFAGFQRQADYTQKTQALAEQRRQVEYGIALQEALQKDPAKTLQLLSDTYGSKQPTPEQEELLKDPTQAQLVQLEGRIRAFEEKEALTALERTVASLTERYGSEFDAEEVVAKALATGSSDLEAVYKVIAFDRVFEKGSASRSAEAKRIADETASKNAKRGAQIVSGGKTSQTATLPSTGFTSLEDAFKAATAEHNA